MNSKAFCGAVVLASMAIAAPASADSSKSQVSDDKLVCKKRLETGSLVRKTKQCFTQAEWDKIAYSQRQGAEKLADGLTSKSSGQ